MFDREAGVRSWGIRRARPRKEGDRRTHPTRPAPGQAFFSPYYIPFSHSLRKLRLGEGLCHPPSWEGPSWDGTLVCCSIVQPEQTWRKVAWLKRRVTLCWCYSLDLECSPIAFVLKAFLCHQPVVLLGGGGTFRRWGLSKKVMSLVAWSWRSIGTMVPLFFLSLSLSCHEVSSFASPHALYGVLCHTGPETMEPSDHGMHFWNHEPK
jgi:hypothetical protein